MTKTLFWRALKMFVAMTAPTFAVVAIVMWELTSVSGKLVAHDEAPFAGASVQLKDEKTEQTWDVVTDKRGSFLFRHLLPGIYGIKVSADGFADSAIASIKVKVGRSSATGKITLHFSRPKTPKELREDAEDMGRPFTEASWTWADKHGNTCTFEDLYNALSEHWSWLESGKPRHGPEDEIEIRAMPSIQLRLTIGGPPSLQGSWRQSAEKRTIPHSLMAQKWQMHH